MIWLAQTACFGKLGRRYCNSIIVNYAAFLEENHYFEESFKVDQCFLCYKILILLQVYERGVELFTFPVSFELWNIYLSKFVKRYVGSLLFRRAAFEPVLPGWLKA